MYLSPFFASEIEIHPSFPANRIFYPCRGSVADEPILPRFCAIEMDSIIFSPRTEFSFPDGAQGFSIRR